MPTAGVSPGRARRGRRPGRRPRRGASVETPGRRARRRSGRAAAARGRAASARRRPRPGPRRARRRRARGCPGPASPSRRGSSADLAVAGAGSSAPRSRRRRGSPPTRAGDTGLARRAECRWGQQRRGGQNDAPGEPGQGSRKVGTGGVAKRPADGRCRSGAALLLARISEQRVVLRAPARFARRWDGWFLARRPSGRKPQALASAPGRGRGRWPGRGAASRPRRDRGASRPRRGRASPTRR